MATQPKQGELPRVLVVDDYADARYIVREILSFSGFQVLEAANGTDALRSALEEEPDVVLMDLSLPGLDGAEVTKRMRLDERTIATPVIAFTAHALEEDRQRALAAGCDRVLVKPCQPSDIVDAVRAALANGREGAVTVEAAEKGGR